MSHQKKHFLSVISQTWVILSTGYSLHFLFTVFLYFLSHLSPAPQGRAPVSPPSSPARTQQRRPQDPPPRCACRSLRWSRC